MATNDKLIQVKHLKKYYNKGTLHALDDVSVDINRGDVMVVIGPSGSGKSTLLHILGGVYRPSSGKVWLVGQYVFAQNEEQLAIL
ncbi:MAG: ATP-binding cassette domain-containing protein, partial [Oscillospiraceae bacterium]|nr:ATP-binding cassette domain-containing protein [Oscillospiraceae bacterium]